MRVRLDRFSKFKAPKQGKDIHRLVTEQSDWLEDAFPETVRRYSEYPDAIKNVARLASSDVLNAYIIRLDRVARGLATIIFDQTVIHPRRGEVSGNDLDYWIAPPASNELHKDIATAVLLENTQLEHRRRHGCPHSVIGEIKTGQANPPEGLADIMFPVGDPAVLATPSGDDPFGVTKGGAQVQLYQAYR